MRHNWKNSSLSEATCSPDGKRADAECKGCGGVVERGRASFNHIKAPTEEIAFDRELEAKQRAAKG